MSIKVKLTLQQADQVDWALGALVDHWTTNEEIDEPETIEDVEDMPKLVADGDRKTTKILILSPHDHVNRDLLYRLETQLPDMARQSSGFDGDAALAGSCKAAKNAARRIRHAIKHHS
jgi:hypothetical protein